MTVTAAGDTVTGITLTNKVLITGGSHPGSYTVTVTEAVHGGSLVITSWTMTPPGQAPPTATPPGTSTTSTPVVDVATKSPWAGTEVTGAAAYDTDAVGATGGATPSGTVTYQLFRNSTCAAPAALSQSVTLAAGAVPNSPASGPLSAGAYSYLAQYSGDAHYGAVAGTCEPFSVGPATPKPSSVVVDAATKTAWANIEQAGAEAYDTAREDGTPGIAPMGSVTFEFFTNGTCTAPVSNEQTVNLFDGAVPNGATSVRLPKGRYSYQTQYGGDTNYLPVTSACEPFSVGVTKGAAPAKTATAAAASTGAFGFASLDTVRLTGGAIALVVVGAGVLLVVWLRRRPS